jgi:RNA polymerase sigma-70 factor (ECF subfamily)
MLKLINNGRRPDRHPAPAAWHPLEGDELAGLTLRGQRGERDAIRTLVMTLGPAMLRMVRRVLGPRDPDVEDVFQEATMGLVRALPAFRADCSTRHFACRIATLTALKARRRRTGERDATWARVEDEDRQPAIEARDWLLASHRRETLRRLLDELPDAQAEALVLHCVAGFTIEELAAATQAPAETARSRLRLAKAALRERISLDPSLSELLEDAP